MELERDPHLRRSGHADGPAHLEVVERRLAVGGSGRRHQTGSEGQRTDLLDPVAGVGPHALARRVADRAEPAFGHALGPVVAVVGDDDDTDESQHQADADDEAFDEPGPQRGVRLRHRVRIRAHPEISSSSRPLDSGMYRYTSQMAGICMIISSVTVSPMLPMAPVAWSPRMPTSAGPKM